MQRKPRAMAPAPAFDWVNLRKEATDWAKTLRTDTDHPVVAFGQIYACGNGIYDSWQAEPLDVPRHVAIELMQWLKARAEAELGDNGGDHAA